MEFEVTTGTTDAGSCDFTVRLGQECWSCSASYIGAHPLYPLIHSAVSLYNQLFVDPIPEESAVCDSRIVDEPGGILIRANPGYDSVKLRIFHDRRAESVNELLDSPVASGTTDYWEYAEAVLKDAMRAVARQGFLGLRNGWRGTTNWGFDFEYEILPIEQLVYLAYIVHHRKPPNDSNLRDEFELLKMFAEKND